MAKRYLLFFGPVYYPGKGSEDFVASFDKKEQAKDLGEWLSNGCDYEQYWYEVVDQEEDLKDMILKERN